MNQNGTDTDELLRLAATGDETAIGALLERHRSALSRMIAVRMDPRLRGRVDPSDVIQETLSLASQRLPSYATERPIPFYPWLRQDCLGQACPRAQPPLASNQKKCVARAKRLAGTL